MKMPTQINLSHNELKYLLKTVFEGVFGHKRDIGAMAETVWLQMGPTMRALYGRLRRKEPPQFHRLIIAALKAGDEPGLRLAVRSDVTQGLRMLAS